MLSPAPCLLFPVALPSPVPSPAALCAPLLPLVHIAYLVPSVRLPPRALYSSLLPARFAASHSPVLPPSLPPSGRGARPLHRRSTQPVLPPPVVRHWVGRCAPPLSLPALFFALRTTPPYLYLQMVDSFGPRRWGLPAVAGGCGWSRCPQNRILSHVAKDMAYSPFVAVGIWSFLGLFGPFARHIMELEGRKELVDTGKSSLTWHLPNVSLCLDVLNVIQGFFGPKPAVCGPRLQFLKLRSATCESRFSPPLLIFLSTLGVIVLQSLQYHPPNIHLNPKQRVLTLAHFARAACLLLACCLLACCLLAA